MAKPKPLLPPFSYEACPKCGGKRHPDDERCNEGRLGIDGVFLIAFTLFLYALLAWGAISFLATMIGFMVQLVS